MGSVPDGLEGASGRAGKQASGLLGRRSVNKPAAGCRFGFLIAPEGVKGDTPEAGCRFVEDNVEAGCRFVGDKPEAGCRFVTDRERRDGGMSVGMRWASAYEGGVQCAPIDGCRTTFVRTRDCEDVDKLLGD